jgi:NNP family nitrate/nitrite transporter-like MFS transporter
VSTVGAYLAASYLALAAGAVAAGSLANTGRRRRFLLLLTGALDLPGVWLLGQVTAAWQLVVLTALVWFLGGMGLATVSILAGVRAEPDRRGTVFGAVGLAGAVGSVVGALAAGGLVERRGYPAMFTATALALLAWLVAAALVDDHPDQPGEAAPGGGVRPGAAFRSVFLATLLMAAAGFAAVLGGSLLMDRLGFAAAAISGTAAVAAAVAVPVPLVGGWLSDRLGRLPMLVACALLGGLGLVVLAGAATVWQVWIAMSLVAVMVATGGAIGPALVADLTPGVGRDRAVALVNAATWLGAIVGFAGFGTAASVVGVPAALLAGAALPVLAIAVLVLAVRVPAAAAPSVPPARRGPAPAGVHDRGAASVRRSRGGSGTRAPAPPRAAGRRRRPAARRS